MKKLTRDDKWKIKYNNSITESFRDLINKEIGKLNTANSFMYLYRRFGEPTSNNADEYKILYSYHFKHEDLIVTIHASYHEFVYFGLLVPQQRFIAFIKERKKFWQRMYRKYNKIPFTPYSTILLKPDFITIPQNKANLKKINESAVKYFSKEDDQYLDEQLIKKDPEPRVWELLRPFEKKLCDNFRKQLTKEELHIVRNSWPTIKDIPGLQTQLMGIIKEIKKGAYVRDVAINIKGYESKTNIINTFIE